MDAMNQRLSCRGALALELRPGARAPASALDPEAAGSLVAEVARDLAGFAPGIVALDLGLVAALFDPVELLRPGWPLHAELERLVAQAPNRQAAARVVAFGASAGELPASLRPNPDFAEGALRLLPFVVRGDPEPVAEVGRRFEESLLETGMAGAATALFAQEHFGAAIEHARYLTVHDLAAMMALQYEHAGLALAWPLIETALLAPEREAWLNAPPEPLIRLSSGRARVALFDDDAWNAQGYAPTGADATKLERAFERFQMRQRQIAALLEAHGIAVTFDHCPAGKDARAILLA
jgi:hypothetical protein